MIFSDSTLWLNPHFGTSALPPDGVSPLAGEQAVARLERFAPLLARIFPSLRAKNGRIESRLLSVPAMQRALRIPEVAGRLFVKGDHELPVVGSIKARGGMYEVLLAAEQIAIRSGLLKTGDNTAKLADQDARAVFARHRIAVGSTGNLGLSIGLTAAGLGFKVSVYMSTDAKAWKKQLLRAHGAEVLEIDGDYRLAVAKGRESAASDPACHFVDDEDSLALLLGYSTAAPYLAAQLATAGMTVDAAHPLFVYLPCGVGGAPAGLLYGLSLVFGRHVHGFFAEPVQSACFKLQMLAPEGAHPTVYDAGLTNRTEADGLAVPSASLLAAAVAAPLLAGGITVTDETLLAQVYALKRTQDLAIEASAAAGFSGPGLLLESEGGRQYLKENGLEASLPQATHLAWLTGGSLMPASEYETLYARGAKAWGSLDLPAI